MQLREERPGDAEVIAKVTAAAFAPVPYSDGSEPRIVKALRDAGALAVSLVAERDGEVIGHVAFSPVRIDGGHIDWFGLGPVSVAPEYQRQGIGAALIEAGLDRLRAIGGAGCVVLGDPAYYRRFGFAHDPSLAYAGGPPEAFQRLVLRGQPPVGAVHYHAAFG